MIGIIEVDKRWSISSELNLINNHNKENMVGKSLTYADILVAHITTWMVEECGVWGGVKPAKIAFRLTTGEFYKKTYF